MSHVLIRAHNDNASPNRITGAEWKRLPISNLLASQAVLRSDEMRKTNRVLGDLSKNFIPVMYDVAVVF